MSVALEGTPTALEKGIINVNGFPYSLAETGGDTTAQQAAAWAIALNASTPFNQDFTAVASGNVIAISYKSTGSGYNLPSFVTSSVHLTLTATTPPLALGTVTLIGTPATGDSPCVVTVGLTSYSLPETSGFTIAQQAAAWCTTLNATPSFSGSYLANNSGGVINLFTLTALSSGALVLSAVSSAHLALVTYSELQNRQQFLQSIGDVVSDEIPAHARWYLQSELSQQ
jgi:hypothetical protein